MLGMKEILVKVTNDVFYSSLVKKAKKITFSDISCPGDQNPCSGSGICDLAIGECTCNEGHQGSDCSGEKLFVNIEAYNFLQIKS